jgi:metallophosphoesterase superfamily enzyme
LNALEAVRAGVLQLLPERAAFAPAAKTLFVADLHLGKAATFRAFGAPAPTGVSEETVRRLAELTDTTKSQHVVMLGDFTHARAAMTRGLFESLCAWRSRWSSLAFTIVLGNHDRGAKPFYSECGFSSVKAPAVIAGIECWHHPIDGANGGGASRARGPRSSGRPPERTRAGFASHALLHCGEPTDRAACLWRVHRRLARRSV